MKLQVKHDYINAVRIPSNVTVGRTEQEASTNHKNKHTFLAFTMYPCCRITFLLNG